MAFRVEFKKKTIYDSLDGDDVDVTPEPLVVPGESVQLWGGGSLVVVDSQNKQTAIFAGGFWARAIREDDAEG